MEGSVIMENNEKNQAFDIHKIFVPGTRENQMFKEEVIRHNEEMERLSTEDAIKSAREKAKQEVDDLATAHSIKVLIEKRHYTLDAAFDLLDIEPERRKILKNIVEKNDLCELTALLGW